MLSLLFLAPHLLFQLFFSLLIRCLFLLFPPNLSIPIAFHFRLVQFLISTLIYFHSHQLSLFLFLLHTLHTLQNFLMIVALAGDPFSLLVAAVFAEDLPILSLFK